MSVQTEKSKEGQNASGSSGAGENANGGGTSGDANTGSNGGGEGQQQTAQGAEELAKLRKDFEDFRKRSNEENKRHRETADKAKKEADELRGSLAKALGVDPEKSKAGAGGDPSDALKAAEARQRRLLLRSEFTAVAAKSGVVDAGDAFALAERMLGDVDVDLSSDTVDRAALESKVAELKAAKPFLFTAPVNQSGEAPKPPTKMPDGSGRPNGETGTAYERWQKLVKAGDSGDVAKKQESMKFYAQNKAAIAASWPRQ